MGTDDSIMGGGLPDSRLGIERPAPPVQIGRRWGIWIYGEHAGPFLGAMPAHAVQSTDPGDSAWDFSLSSVASGRDLLRLIDDLRHKSWVRRVDIGDLMIALNDIGLFEPYW
ncbi:hypothetical protein [Sphingomonas nostoxanthinifaciens]|uniref:hypothetical protein n=1 Tax=Sphingomonas nostoxanthinifaciens TaxID=2872652 RepID=UPI001CC1D93A|nr:hypothetical protein [Sphingomonas nostoxanthinifaciens]UAK25851.1 hypothetical protein K8P63_06930 [Sphingomonas nostoxanthinifaciens]